MPDHLHLFVKLTGALGISRCVARFKAKTSRALNAAGLVWQANFFEHRLRANEAVGPVLRYLHLNPYRKALLGTGAKWPWFWLGAEDASWFDATLDDGKPQPEWLR